MAGLWVISFTLPLIILPSNHGAWTIIHSAPPTTRLRHSFQVHISSRHQARRLPLHLSKPNREELNASQQMVNHRNIHKKAENRPKSKAISKSEKKSADAVDTNINNYIHRRKTPEQLNSLLQGVYSLYHLKGLQLLSNFMTHHSMSC